MRLGKFLESVLESGLILFLLFTALIRVPSHVLEAVIVFSAISFIVLYAIRISRDSSRISSRLIFVFPVIMFFLIVGFQMLPLSPVLLAKVSPKTFALYEKAYYLIGSAPRLKTNISVYNHSTRMELLLLLAYGSFFYLVANSFSSYRSRRRLIFALILIGFIYSALGPFLLRRGIWNRAPVLRPGAVRFSPLPYQAHFVEYLEVTFLVTLGFLLQYLHDLRKLRSPFNNFIRGGSAFALGLILLLMFISPFLSTSARSPLLIFPISLVVMILLGNFLPSPERERRKLIAILAVVVLFVLAVLFCPLPCSKDRPVIGGIGGRLELLRHKLFSFRLSPSAEEAAPDRTLPLSYDRADIYRDTLKMIGKFPLFGVGLGNFKDPFAFFKTSYHYASLQRPHNDYLELLGETGLVGFGLVMVLLIRFFRDIFRQLPYTSWQFVGLAGALAALLLEGLFTFPMENPAIFILAVFIAGLLTTELPPKRKYRLPGSAAKKMLFLVLLLFALTVWGTSAGRSLLARSFYLRAQVLEDQRKKAIQYCLKAIRLDASDAGYHSLLAKLFWKNFSTGRRGSVTWKRETEKQFLQAVFLNPLNARLHYRLGDFYAKIGEARKAEVEFRKSVYFSPTNPQFLRRLAQLYLEAGEVGLAVDLYRKAVQIRPDYLGGIIQIVYAHTGDWLTLKEIVPPEEEYYLKLYRFLKMEEDDFRAEKIIGEAREKFPEGDFTRWD